RTRSGARSGPADARRVPPDGCFARPNGCRPCERSYVMPPRRSPPTYGDAAGNPALESHWRHPAHRSRIWTNRPLQRNDAGDPVNAHCDLCRAFAARRSHISARRTAMRPTFAWLFAATVVLTASRPAAAQHSFSETDLVSDLAGRAALTDPDLVNPWGLVPGAQGVFWASNNGTGTSTLYQPSGAKVGLVVTIPGGANTGVALTDANAAAFAIPSADTTARAIFIFVSEGGTISAWSNRLDPTKAVQVASTP